MIPKPTKEGLLVLNKTSSSYSWEIEDNFLICDWDGFKIDRISDTEFEVQVLNPSPRTLYHLEKGDLYIGISIEDASLPCGWDSSCMGETRKMFHPRETIKKAMNIDSLDDTFYFDIGELEIPHGIRRIFSLADFYGDPDRNDYWFNVKFCLCYGSWNDRSGQNGNSRVYKTSKEFEITIDR